MLGWVASNNYIIEAEYIDICFWLEVLGRLDSKLGPEMSFSNEIAYN